MNGPIKGAFAGRSVLVTGHTGFKGSWLAMWLQHLGARVSGYGLAPPTSPSLYEAAGVTSCVDRDWRADVRNLPTLRRAVEATRPDVIFHLAAQPLVRRAWAEPADTFAVNVMGSVNVLEAVRLAGRPCAVIMVTTDKCYENSGATSPFAEGDRLGGTEPYGTSKAAAELVVEAYRHTYFPPERHADHGVSVASVRAGNVIGGGDWSADRIVPDVVRALISDRRVQVRFPEAVRPWQHVTVPLSGYLQLATVLLAQTLPPALTCSAWNFGPRSDSEVTVSQLVDDAVRLWGEGEWQSVPDPLRPHEAGVLRLDIDKARRVLGWQPAWGYDDAMRHTVSWYRSYVTDPGFDPARACLEDIRAYERACGWGVSHTPATQASGG